MSKSSRILLLLGFPILGRAARIARVQTVEAADEAAEDDLEDDVDPVALRDAAAGDKDVCTKWFERLPAEFRAGYPDARFLNSGVKGCGFLATEQKTGSTVVLKVGKGPSGNPVSKWRGECEKMRKMHEAACRAGPEALELAQTYLPTCIDFMPFAERGQKVPYFVMHAAPKTQFHDVDSLHLDEGARKEAFAQLVAAVYSMHAAGWYHNDMHERNVMIGMEGGHPELAVIDFGKADRKALTRWSFHDGIKLLTHLETLCGKMPQCLTRWDVDQASFKAFEEWTALAQQVKAEQGVEKIFNTPFVQEYAKHHADRPYVIKTSCSGQAPPVTKPPSEAASEEHEETTPSPLPATPSPLPTSRRAECKSPDNPRCNKLSGLCCPAKNGKMLACC